jgi:hypothetical protein
MKKLSLNLTLFLGFICFSGAQAQSQTSTPADYFAGKWHVTIFGTPNGDAKMAFVFDKKDGKLTGVVQDTTGKEISKITQIDTAGKSITAAFYAEGYDLKLTLEPVDEQHVKGNLLNMFDATGVRIKETK